MGHVLVHEHISRRRRSPCALCTVRFHGDCHRHYACREQPHTHPQTLILHPGSQSLQALTWARLGVTRQPKDRQTSRNRLQGNLSMWLSPRLLLYSMGHGSTNDLLPIFPQNSTNSGLLNPNILTLQSFSHSHIHHQFLWATNCPWNKLFKCYLNQQEPRKARGQEQNLLHPKAISGSSTTCEERCFLPKWEALPGWTLTWHSHAASQCCVWQPRWLYWEGQENSTQNSLSMQDRSLISLFRKTPQESYKSIAVLVFPVYPTGTRCLHKMTFN